MKTTLFMVLIALTLVSCGGSSNDNFEMPEFMLEEEPDTGKEVTTTPTVTQQVTHIQAVVSRPQSYTTARRAQIAEVLKYMYKSTIVELSKNERFDTTMLSQDYKSLFEIDNTDDRIIMALDTMLRDYNKKIAALMTINYPVVDGKHAVDYID